MVTFPLTWESDLRSGIPPSSSGPDGKIRVSCEQSPWALFASSDDSSSDESEDELSDESEDELEDESEDELEDESPESDELSELL